MHKDCQVQILAVREVLWIDDKTSIIFHSTVMEVKKSFFDFCRLEKKTKKVASVSYIPIL